MSTPLAASGAPSDVRNTCNILHCSISGDACIAPVIVPTSGRVYERSVLLRALAENGGKDPVGGGAAVVEDDLVAIRGDSGAVPPRPPRFSSVPGILHALRDEYDAAALETHALRRALDETRRELSQALYRADAAVRVIARVTAERDEAR
eukprot:CAMPEP_0194314500 /NCGR_PEP_ID=MMETSP0171-20130528/11348_1 /TAXON_ID=218684 /ORGANISM="Corethron pennatum, Strain L29A3" /LENGTH=149 /DNA_ID=CAMNT_0039069935 /DNA_START=149 /DNA_END=594 /DNA_ORIENTATION=-